MTMMMYVQNADNAAHCKLIHLVEDLFGNKIRQCPGLSIRILYSLLSISFSYTCNFDLYTFIQKHAFIASQATHHIQHLQDDIRLHILMRRREKGGGERGFVLSRLIIIRLRTQFIHLNISSFQ